jgi:phage anti-repressor protein
MLKSSTGSNITNIKDFNMKFLKAIYDFFCAIGLAKHAANLARNGKTKQAQALYQD